MSDMADRRQWHLDKSVSVAHIITTVAMVVSALWFLAGQDRRISNLELNYAHLKAAGLKIRSGLNASSTNSRLTCA